MKKIPSRDKCFFVLAGREPCLSDRGQGKTVGSSGAPHFGCHPAGLHCVGENFGPSARDGEGKNDIVQFGISVGSICVPSPGPPCQILKAGIPASVKTRADVNQSFWS